MHPADEQVKSALSRHPEIRVAILFGSRLTAAVDSTSDLDVAVAGDKPLNVDEKMGLIDDLAVVAGCPVDIIDLATVTGPILQQALCKGRIIVNRDPPLLARLMLKMWYNQADMMPSYRMIQRRRVEAFAHG